MIIHLLPPWVWVTVIPVGPLLLLAIVFQPHQLFPARHRVGVRATRIIRREEAARKRSLAAHPAPTGWQSPAWTVQIRELAQP